MSIFEYAVETLVTVSGVLIGAAIGIFIFAWAVSIISGWSDRKCEKMNRWGRHR
jgi:hypothetical protein